MINYRIGVHNVNKAIILIKTQINAKKIHI